MQYLGKTTKNPYLYRGSGKDWVPHIKEYGYDVTTEVLKECASSKELSVWGRHYSELWNIVDSPTWANRIPETGGGIGNGGGSAISENTSLQNRMRVDAGTHPWVNKEQQKLRALKRVEEGVCPFAGEAGSELSKRVQQERVADGTHHLLGGEIQRRSNAERVANGTHHLLGGALQKKMVEDGTHPFLSGEISKRTQQERVQNGTHHFLKPITESHPTQWQWKCEKCGSSGKGKANYKRWHGDNCTR